MSPNAFPPLHQYAVATVAAEFTPRKSHDSSLSTSISDYICSEHQKTCLAVILISYPSPLVEPVSYRRHCCLREATLTVQTVRPFCDLPHNSRNQEHACIPPI